MPYTITLADGLRTLITVPDRAIIGPLAISAPSNCSINLVGRGSVGYGMAITTNSVWMLENFAAVAPPPAPLQGQLWYSKAIGNATLQLFNTSNKWVQVATADAPFTFTGDITVADNRGDQATLGANGTITLIRPDFQPRIAFKGALDANATIVQLGTDSLNLPDLIISNPAFPGNKTGAIWHSINLTPFNLNANNIVTGNNLFTGSNVFSNATHFREIIVDDVAGSAVVDITPGSITLKTIISGAAPAVKFFSTNPTSGNAGALSFNDPNLAMNFYAGASATGSLLFNPSGTTSDTASQHTVYHTGNLSPIVQTAASQSITGNLVLAGGGNRLTVQGGLTVQTGGAFTGALTLNGLPVLTTADKVAGLGFTPVQQGTGVGQSTNTVKVGWSGTGLKATVDQDDKGYFLMSPSPSLSLPFLPLAGGTVSGVLGVTGGLTVQQSGAFTGTLTLNGLPVLTTADKIAGLGFTPVQQGTGFAQGNSAVKIGWATTGGLKVTVDTTDRGYFVLSPTANLALPFLSLSGGTVTGPLVLTNGLTVQQSNSAFTGTLTLNGLTVLTSADKVAGLGFTPVQQGGGVGQGTNAVKIGWATTGLKVTVDTTDRGYFVLSSTPSLSLPYLPLTGGTLTGPLAINGGAFSVTGRADIGGAMGVSGGAVIAGATTIGNNLGVQGQATITGRLDIGGAMGVSGGAVITGATTIGNNLGVQGLLTVAGSISAASLTTPGAVTGKVINSIDGDVVANGTGRLRANNGAYGSTDGSIATLLADFGFLKLFNGYAFLPSGFTIQWGQNSTGLQGIVGGLTVDFNTPFPVAALCVMVCPLCPQGVYNENNVQAAPLSRTNFWVQSMSRLNSSNFINANFFWMAYGY